MALDSTAVSVAFAVALVSGFALLVTLVVSIVSEHRFWPHGDPDWTFLLGWTLWILYTAGLLAVAYLDLWSAYQPSTAVTAATALSMAGGGLLCLWAAWTLGFRESSGLEGEIETRGPYRYSRNPQYVGIVLMLVAGSVLVGSWSAAVLALVGVVWFLLAPLAEEPWLREQYGKEYERYKGSVPRFIGPVSFAER